MIRYLLLLPVSIAMTMLAYALAPVLPLFAQADNRLPNWLRWFGQDDNDLDGDSGWKNEHFVGWPRYIKRVLWLWRNPCYSFEQSGPLAAKITSDIQVQVSGNPQIKNRTNAVSGWYFCRVGKCWNFKAVLPLFDDLAFMPEFGWKLQGYAQGRETEGKAMYVFSLRLTAFYLCIHPKED